VPLPATRKPLTANAVAAAPVEQVLRRLGSSADGLSSGEVGERLALNGPNAIRTHHVSAWAVLARQLNNAVLILLAITAVLLYFLGDHTQALIIGVILTASIGLGLFNEFRAEQAAAALHSRIRHTAIVRRDGRFGDVDVRNLVPGDVIRRSLGQAVPADVRLIETAALECDESYLLLRVAFALTVLILVTNLMLHRPLINSAPFCAGHRGQHHAATAPCGCEHQPGDGLPATGQRKGAGQTTGMHRRLRRPRHFQHRQDWNADRGPH
jgi:hypothetical protein